MLDFGTDPESYITKYTTYTLSDNPLRVFAAICPMFPVSARVERELFIDNLLVRIHFITVMIGWTGLAHRREPVQDLCPDVPCFRPGKSL